MKAEFDARAWGYLAQLPESVRQALRRQLLNVLQYRRDTLALAETRHQAEAESNARFRAEIARARQLIAEGERR